MNVLKKELALSANSFFGEGKVGISAIAEMESLTVVNRARLEIRKPEN
ncbi:hypothetical protein GPK38_09615 [Enterococcus faecium]|nr:hypothetical protein [Enterococcus faecium]